MYGQITALDDGSVTITGAQHHGNCPKYITRRKISERERLALAIETKARNSLNADDTALVKAADTFLKDGSGAPYDGVDVNHRDGQPGFVLVVGPS